jgi:hypothetical protein
MNGKDSGSDEGTDLGGGVSAGKRKLDSLRIFPYRELAAGCDTVAGRYIRRWYVTTNRVSEFKSVELLVSWPLSARHTITFNTLVGNDLYKIH